MHVLKYNETHYVVYQTKSIIKKVSLRQYKQREIIKQRYKDKPWGEIKQMKATQLQLCLLSGLSQPRL